MSYKRIIFALLFFDGNFYLSRNFRLQKVGNIDWIKMNYDFGETCNSIDELIVLNINKVSSSSDSKLFFDNIKVIKKNFFLPLTIGGGIRKFEDAKKCFNEGADKIILNTLFYENIMEIKKISDVYGNQANSIMIDYKKFDNKNIFCFKKSGLIQSGILNQNFINRINNCHSGDVIFNSIDLDGTGMGFDLDLLKKNYIKKILKPILLMGGAGKSDHIEKAFDNLKLSGIVTANLFNFLGSGLSLCRKKILEFKKYLAKFD